MIVGYKTVAEFSPGLLVVTSWALKATKGWHKAQRERRVDPRIRAAPTRVYWQSAANVKFKHGRPDVPTVRDLKSQRADNNGGGGKSQRGRIVPVQRRSARGK